MLEIGVIFWSPCLFVLHACEKASYRIGLEPLDPQEFSLRQDYQGHLRLGRVAVQSILCCKARLSLAIYPTDVPHTMSYSEWRKALPESQSLGCVRWGHRGGGEAATDFGAAFDHRVLSNEHAASFLDQNVPG